MMIDVAFVGSTKAASTSMYEWLSTSPEIVLPSVKESHYFSQGVFGSNYTGLEREVCTMDEYRGLFPRNGHVRDGLYVDYDALSMHGPIAADLLWESNPRVKIVFILRNPVERSISQWRMDRREGRESRTLARAFEEDSGAYLGGSNGYLPMIRLSFYASAIEKFIKRFGRRSVRVWLYEDLRVNPERTCREICDFVRISGAGMSPFSSFRENRHGVARCAFVAYWLRARHGKLRVLRDFYVKLPWSLRRRIRSRLFVDEVGSEKIPFDFKQRVYEFYREDMAKTEHLIGRCFGSGSSVLV